MNRSNFGAVRLPLLAAAVLASFAVPLSAQVVEKGRTLADLIASHPCDTGLENRIARVTDCDSATDFGDGDGAFQCWAYCDGSAPWTNLSIGGGGGGGDVLLAGDADGQVIQGLTGSDSARVDIGALNSNSVYIFGAGAAPGYIYADDGGATLSNAADNSYVSVNTAGVTIASAIVIDLATTAPAATTGPSQAGGPVSITASPAVASTDTAGAAAGGDITLTAGAAARFTSGNANGGDINLVPGAGIGTGVSGQVVFPDGTLANPSGGWGPGAISGIYYSSGLHIAHNGSERLTLVGAGVQLNALLQGQGNAIEGYKHTTTASTAGVGSPLGLVSDDSFKVRTNEGSTAENYYTLPTAVAGYQFTFVVQDADGIRITAAAGDTIRPIAGTAASAAAGFIRCATQGAFITLVAINATEWVAIGSAGTWTIDV